MFKFLKIILTFLSLNISAWALELFPTYETSILEINGSVAIIEDSYDIYVGSSGIVMHAFDEEKNTIIARAEVISKENGHAKLRFLVYDDLEQNAFPLPGILPSVGDKIILNYLYNRSLLITPNMQVYEQIINSFPDIDFVNPDVVASYLYVESKPNPKKHTFHQICQINAAGLIFFALDKKGIFADCKSLKILKIYEANAIVDPQTPFFNHIGEIKSAIWNYKDRQIKNYDEYYKKLLQRYNQSDTI